MLAEIEGKEDHLSYLEEPNEFCWKFLATRFFILKQATENTLATNFKNLHSEDSIENLSRITMILLQLLKNEVKVLEMLVHCANDRVVSP